MALLSSRNVYIWFILGTSCFFIWFFSNKIDLTPMRETIDSCPARIEYRFNDIKSASSFISYRRYTSNLSCCWTDSDYQLWKQGKYFPRGNSKGHIVYMVMTGNPFLRSRCDIIMCTIGATLHPSRLFFVGETSSDSRLPIYDVVTPETRRPVDRAGSMQKLAQGLAMITEKINQSDYKNEIQWIMVMDDDTFVSPPNLESLVAEYDTQRSLMIGQASCGVGFCGGAGYLISRALFNQLPSFVKQCQPSRGIDQSDQFVPQCIKKRTQVEFIDRKEFYSQPPEFYFTTLRSKDHPDAFGRAVSFHYIRPAARYVDLWRLHQAYAKKH